MKKIMFLAIALLTAYSFLSACSSGFTCTCTLSTGGLTDSAQSFHLNDTSYREAVTNCLKLEDSVYKIHTDTQKVKCGVVPF